MAKCKRCGKSTALRGTVEIKDGTICGKCFKELGFEKRDLLTASLYLFDEIKDGREMYYKNKIKRDVIEVSVNSKPFVVANYGQERDLVCTEEEREIFNRIVDEFPDESLRLTRVSDDYVSIKRGEWDIVRLKYTNRAKWLMFPTYEAKQLKHRIERTVEVEDYFETIRESIETAKKYED